MSGKEKMIVDDVEEEKEEDSDEQCSDEESDIREIVLGLPALRVSNAEEEEARLNEQAVVAAELVIAAAEEAVMKGNEDGSGGKKKKKSRPRKTMSVNEVEGSSTRGEVKKAKKKAPELTNPPKGPPACKICGKGFASWKAVFGHMRSHKDRNYQGFLPPPTFSAAAAEKFSIPGPNSAFVLVTAGGGSLVGLAAGGGGGSGAVSGVGADPGGEGGRGLGIDLNMDPLEEVEEKNESESVAKFDLNKSPPKDEEEEK